MHKVLIQLGLLDLPKVVGIRKLQNRDSVLVSVRLEDVGEMGSFCFGRDSQTVRPESRQSSDRIHTRLSHPDGMVFLKETTQKQLRRNDLVPLRRIQSRKKRINLDSGLNGTLEPYVVGFLISSVKLVVSLESHVGQERRLCSAQVLGQPKRKVWSAWGSSDRLGRRQERPNSRNFGFRSRFYLDICVVE